MEPDQHSWAQALVRAGSSCGEGLVWKQAVEHQPFICARDGGYSINTGICLCCELELLLPGLLSWEEHTCPRTTLDCQ